MFDRCFKLFDHDFKGRRRRRRKVYSKLTQGSERWTLSATGLPWCRRMTTNARLFKANAVDGARERWRETERERDRERERQREIPDISAPKNPMKPRPRSLVVTDKFAL